MKRALLRLALAAVFCLCVSVSASALDTGNTEGALPDTARDILGNAAVGDEGLFERVGSAAAEMLAGEIKSALKTGAAVFFASAVPTIVKTAFPDAKTPDFTVTASALAVAAVSAGSVSSFVSEARETLDGLLTFSNALLPCMASASAMTGYASSAAAKYAASSFFMNALATLLSRAIIPLICAYWAAVTADAAVGGGMLKSAAGAIRWACTALITLSAAAFVITISVTGTVAVSTDAAAIRAAKTAISAAIPVVGGIVSDAAGAVLGGAAALRASIGVFGLAAVTAICAGPIVKLSAYLLIFRAAAACAGPISDVRISELLGNIGAAFGMLLALVGSAGAVLFISVVSAMRTVTG